MFSTAAAGAPARTVSEARRTSAAVVPCSPARSLMVFGTVQPVEARLLSLKATNERHKNKKQTIHDLLEDDLVVCPAPEKGSNSNPSKTPGLMTSHLPCAWTFDPFSVPGGRPSTERNDDVWTSWTRRCGLLRRVVHCVRPKTKTLKRFFKDVESKSSWMHGCVFCMG